ARGPANRLRIAVSDVNQRVPVKKGGGTHPHARKLAMPLFKRFGQPDVEEIAVEPESPNLASLDQGREDVLLERARQIENEVENLAPEHIDSAIDDPCPRPAQILFQEGHNLPILFDYPPIPTGVCDSPQRQGRHRSALTRGLLQGSQIDV